MEIRVQYDADIFSSSRNVDDTNFLELKSVQLSIRGNQDAAYFIERLVDTDSDSKIKKLYTAFASSRAPFNGPDGISSYIKIWFFCSAINTKNYTFATTVIKFQNQIK